MRESVVLRSSFALLLSVMPNRKRSRWVHSVAACLLAFCFIPPASAQLSGPAELAFPLVDIDSGPAFQTIVLANISPDDAIISSIALSGTDATAFSMTAVVPPTVSVAGRSSFAFDAIFDPFRLGSHAAVMTVLYDTSTLQIELSGIGIGTLAIPEPQTYALLLAGLGLLGFAARRRRKANA